MLKIQKIRNKLKGNGFSVFYSKHDSPILEVGVPLPKRKCNVKYGIAFYGIIKIDTTDEIKIIESNLTIIKSEGIPYSDEAIKYVTKMHKAMEKIGRIVLNASITKEDVIQELKENDIDEEIINFIEETWQ